MMYKHTMTVSGRGLFPLDMLRYDTCFPVKQTDVDAIHASLIRDEDHYVVTVMQYSDSKKHGYTLARWASFGTACSEPVSERRS